MRSAERTLTKHEPGARALCLGQDHHTTSDKAGVVVRGATVVVAGAVVVVTGATVAVVTEAAVDVTEDAVVVTEAVVEDVVVVTGARVEWYDVVDVTHLHAPGTKHGYWFQLVPFAHWKHLSLFVSKMSVLSVPQYAQSTQETARFVPNVHSGEFESTPSQG